MAKFRMKNNITQLTRDLRLFEKALKKLHTGGSIWTDVEYALFVEVGTVKMRARAMVRKSMPEIEAFFERELVKLPFPFNFSQYRSLLQRTLDFAHERISKNTPVLSGKLKGSWQKSKLRKDNSE